MADLGSLAEFPVVQRLPQHLRALLSHYSEWDYLGVVQFSRESAPERLERERLLNDLVALRVAREEILLLHRAPLAVGERVRVG